MTLSLDLPGGQKATQEQVPSKEELLITSPTRKVLVAKKPFHRRYLLGHIHYGGGEIDLGDGYGLSFISNGDFVTMQLFRYAKDAVVQTQTWNKGVKEKPKPKVVQKKIIADEADVEQVL